MHNNLLLLLQPLHYTYRHFQHVRHNIRRRERQPLRQTHIRDALALIDFNKREILRRARILNIMPAVIGKHSRVTGFEIECAAVGVAREDGGARGAGVEIEPFFGLHIHVISMEM
jgi:hypothetical protein